MDLDEAIDRYRGSKKQIRFGLAALLSILPAFMYWTNQGDAF